jgi:folate-binding protein YgfZ
MQQTLSPSSAYMSDEPAYEYYRVDGEKALTFLQGQLTNDLTQLSNQSWLYAAHCNIKGRVIALYTLWQQGDDIYLKVPMDIADTAIPTLSNYAKFSRVTLLPQPQLMTLHLWGTGITAFLEQNLGVILSENQSCFQLKDMTLLYVPGVVPSYQLITSSANGKNLYAAWQSQLTVANHVAWDVVAIQNGIARLYANTIGMFTPHELALPERHAVSFNKGCYTGQEIIARMQYRGQLKSHLYQATVTSPITPIPGESLQQEERPCGQLVMSARLDEDTYAVLALLQDKALDAPIFLHQSSLEDIKIIT